MREKIAQWIAYRLPRRIVYFCLIRAWAHATTGKYSDTVVPEVTAQEVIKRWEARDEVP